MESLIGARPWVVALALAMTTGIGAQPVVTVDPGHPSEVADGAGRQNGTTEVHEAWEVGLKLRALLEEAGVKVVMTKARERELVKNRRRAEIANDAHAALMVRLHCDTAAGSGYALYHPDRKGHTQGVTGPDDSIIVESQNAARALHAGMAAALAGELKDDGVKGDSKTFVGGKQGALTGSIFSKVPVVTIEMVVLSNPDDAAWIRTSAGEAKMARAIFRGIATYLKLSPAASSPPASASPGPPARSRPGSSAPR